MCHPKTRDFRPKLQKEQREREKKTNTRILIRETSRLSEQPLRITKKLEVLVAAGNYSEISIMRITTPLKPTQTEN
jgi:hypothetical protein